MRRLYSTQNRFPRFPLRRIGDYFRVARQPPTIVTWAGEHFYDLPLIRPSGFAAALVSAVAPIDVCPAVSSKTKTSCPNEENHGDTYGKSPNKNGAICIETPDRRRQGFSNQELGELRLDRRGMAIIGCYPISVYHTE
jgi:hypothetical protein